MKTINIMNELHNIRVRVDSVQFAEIEKAANFTADCVEGVNLRNTLADNNALFVDYDEIRGESGEIVDEIPFICATADTIANVLCGICGLTADTIAYMLYSMGKSRFERFF